MAKEIWVGLGVADINHFFWESEWDIWLRSNLNVSRFKGFGNWNVIFAISC